jgi:hypothetical protein
VFIHSQAHHQELKSLYVTTLDVGRGLAVKEHCNSTVTPRIIGMMKLQMIAVRITLFFFLLRIIILKKMIVVRITLFFLFFKELYFLKNMVVVRITLFLFVV